jgi:hypothetical protein
MIGFTWEHTMNDQGDWLSAQQAVMPDGSEVSGLRLVNKKLPPLVPPSPASDDKTVSADESTPNPN